jgi:hypothetical protein
MGARLAVLGVHSCQNLSSRPEHGLCNEFFPSSLLDSR